MGTRLFDERGLAGLKGKLREPATALHANQRLCGMREDRLSVRHDHTLADTGDRDEQPIDAVRGTSVALAGHHRLRHRLGMCRRQPGA